MNSRREFIALLGGTAATWPLAARARQSAMPVIGLLTSRGLGDTPQLLAAFRQGLRDGGFVEGQNIAVEYRFAGNRNERLPALAPDLVQRQVSLIAATTTASELCSLRWERVDLIHGRLHVHRLKNGKLRRWLRACALRGTTSHGAGTHIFE
jgi:integrase